MPTKGLQSPRPQDRAREALAKGPALAKALQNNPLRAAEMALALTHYQPYRVEMPHLLTILRELAYQGISSFA